MPIWAVFCRHRVTFTAVYFALNHPLQKIQGGAELSLSSDCQHQDQCWSNSYSFAFVSISGSFQVVILLGRSFFISHCHWAILRRFHFSPILEKIPTLFLILFSLFHIFTSLLNLYYINLRLLQFLFTSFLSFFSIYLFVP